MRTLEIHDWGIRLAPAFRHHKVDMVNGEHRHICGPCSELVREVSGDSYAAVAWPCVEYQWIVARVQDGSLA